jgi:hypothetical protein
MLVQIYIKFDIVEIIKTLLTHQETESILTMLILLKISMNLG